MRAAAASTWGPETSTASTVVSIRVLRHSALCSRINKQAVSAEVAGCEMAPGVHAFRLIVVLAAFAEGKRNYISYIYVHLLKEFSIALNVSGLWSFGLILVSKDIIKRLDLASRDCLVNTRAIHQAYACAYTLYNCLFAVSFSQSSPHLYTCKKIMLCFRCCRHWFYYWIVVCVIVLYYVHLFYFLFLVFFCVLLYDFIINKCIWTGQLQCVQKEIVI